MPAVDQRRPCGPRHIVSTQLGAWLAGLICLLGSAGLSARGQDMLPDRPAAAEQEAPALSTEFDQLDPWQRYNRNMYRFNRGLDKMIFRPVARGYQRVTPSLLRRGVSNFFGNLQQPVVMLNKLLQGKPKLAAAALGRFTMNATLGIGGIFDPATEARIPNERADFGQTFARWGWQRSRYFVLPVFGPSTLRDGAGKLVNRQVSPVDWLARRHGAEVSVLYGIDARAGALSAEAFLEDAEDEYLLVRDSYLQYRRCQLIDCSDQLPDYLLPDYEIEIPDLNMESFRQ
ncbi:MlaA family lipoprotein [Pseudomarimonas arenosa]|uniref:VacJ family lipoprotein n=1 Tax=Pseudomarimonas arenosa TaxID=2774145 RepID=A0AAW3ZI23_9GAMM|nr:VacJ family lipoprotein [Pseudomarimonas arenosa]MBD8525735.1 VacJ family lipoprotein [Pseudomarimonas arenosa]